MKEEKIQPLPVHLAPVFATFWDLRADSKPIYRVIVTCPIPTHWDAEAKRGYVKGYVAAREQDTVKKIAETLDIDHQSVGLAIRGLTKDEWKKYTKEIEENGSCREIEVYRPALSDKKGE